MDLYQSSAEIRMSDARNSDDGDSMSDIYQTEDNAESSTDGPHSDARPNENQLNSWDAPERKRKTIGPLPLEEPHSSKRARLDGPTDQEASGSFRNTPQNVVLRLPAENWQHIFTFVPPRTLGSLMMVNKQFNTYLDPSSTAKLGDPPMFSTPSVLPKLKPDTIWQASRRLFWPRMPAALKGRSELEMWRICCSRRCQFCKFCGDLDAHHADDHRRRGPGSKGVSPVFPFSIVSCGRCLEEKSVKEIDLLLNSSTPSALLAGLPMVFLTPENHVIPPCALSSDPLETSPVKVFWDEQIQNIKAEFEATKAFGPAAAEEWIKGLEAEGKRSLVDAGRWERWSLAGGVDEMCRPAPKSLVQTLSKGQDLVTCGLIAPKHMAETTNQWTGPKSAMAVVDRHGEGQTSSQLEPTGACTSQAVKSENHVKLTRGKAKALKAARGAEIERRASILQPPIPLKVLAYMPAFHAALRLTTPLDDNAWQTLRPCLLTQRRDAEKKARDDQIGAQPLVKVAAALDMDNREVTDAHWNQAQAPLRARISAIADEHIKYHWKDGHGLTKSKATHFASNVLLHVRKTFYSEVGEDAKIAKASGKKPVSDPHEGPWTRKLTLENMKWIFDMKIKPHTISRRKEVFVCTGCPGSSKWYGLDGVVQHYASKHTTALSLGNAVVHWRAEWPEKPIFGPRRLKGVLPEKTKKGASGGTLHNDPGSSSEVGHRQQTAPQPTSEYGTYTSFAGTNAPMNYGFGNGHPRQYLPPEGPYEQGYSPYTHPPEYDQTPSRVESYSKYSYNMNGTTQQANYAERTNERGVEFNKAPTQKPLERRVYMVKIARKTWKQVAHIKKLHISVKVCAVIHHIAKKFQEKYSEPAPLDLFIQALPSYGVLRDACCGHCLACKACKLGSDPTLQSKQYSLLALLKHFNSTHSKHAKPPAETPLDWRVDMIWLPEISTLMMLRDVIGNNWGALDVLSDTLPWAFETPNRGHEPPQNGYRYTAANQVPSSKWNMPRHTTSEAFGHSNQRSAAPRLELDGFEIVERPKKAIHYQRHDDRHTRQLQHDTPATASNRFDYAASGYQHHHYPQAAEISGCHEHQWDNVDEKSHNYAHTPTQRGVHSYESHPVETYEIIEVRDSNGDYLIRRPIRRDPLPEARYETHNQSYSAPYRTQYRDHGGGGARVHGVTTTSQVVDYEEYDPRFPAGGDTRYTR